MVERQTGCGAVAKRVVSVARAALFGIVLCAGPVQAVSPAQAEVPTQTEPVQPAVPVPNIRPVNAADLVRVEGLRQPMSPAPSTGDLYGSSWVALLIEEAEIRARPAPSLSFPSSGRASGRASCNDYTADVHISGTSLRFINLGAHLTGCEPKVMEQEQAFLQALGSTRAFLLESGHLVLLDADQKRRLIFARADPAQLPLSREAARRMQRESVSASPPAAGSSSQYASVLDPRAPARVRALEFATMTPALGRYFGTDKGVLVTRADASNVFQLQEGDVLLSVNGRTPANGAHALSVLGSYRPAEALHLELMRDHQPVTLDVTLPP